MTRAMLSQANHVMQRVLHMPSDSTVNLLQVPKGQSCYSTSSHLLTKSRLNMKLKLKLNYSMAHIF